MRKITIEAVRRVFPELIMRAKELGREEFVSWFSAFVEEHREMNPQAVASWRRLIEREGSVIDELSTESRIELHTITLLYRLLRGEVKTGMYADFTEEMLHQLMRLSKPDEGAISRSMLHRRMERWWDGSDPAIVEDRAANKQRIIELLIQRIETRHTEPYCFAPGSTLEQKRAAVTEWWNSYRFHLAMAVKSPSELNRLLNNTLSVEQLRVLKRAKEKGIPFFVTPYYASLLCVGQTGLKYDDQAIRSYILYSEELVETYGSIRAWEREDRVEAGRPNAAGWLLPEGSNIHRRYPEVAILIPDSMGRACGGLCASCQRMYDFQSKRLGFDLERLKPQSSWPQRLRQLMNYFEEDAQLRDILITGGDALMSQNSTLAAILEAVYAMAKRKRAANRDRPQGAKFAELQRVRLGSRLPAYLPMRINDELIEILTRFKAKAQQVGVSQFVLQTHFQSPLELTPEALEGLRRIQTAGWIVTNQLVHNVAASRMGHVARLRHCLNRAGVLCYYTFTVKGFGENYRVFAPNARSIQAATEEKVHGRLDAASERELLEQLTLSDWSAQKMQRFMKKHRLPFIATERNVLNLPGIGKSMAFEMIGVLEDGRRVLEFSHDETRRHSPAVESMDSVFIVENKSIAAYLRQLGEMGEDPSWYHTLWNYTKGENERRFPIFEYPDFDFEVTSEVNHVEK